MPSRNITYKGNITAVRDFPKLSVEDLPTQPQFQETYDPRLDVFTSTTPTGIQGTVQMRPPTPQEREKLDEISYKGDLMGRAVFGVADQVLGGFISSPMTDEEASRFGRSFLELKRPITGDARFVKEQFDVFKSRFDYERDLREAQKTEERLKRINKKFEETSQEKLSKIRNLEEGNVQGGNWVGSERDLERYNKLVEEYNKNIKDYELEFGTYESDEAYQKVLESPERKDMFQRIAESDLTPVQRGVLSGAVGAVELGLLLLPPVRFIRGGEIFSSGLFRLDQAETPEERVGAVGQMGLGVLLGASGLKGRPVTTTETASFLTGKGTLSSVARKGLTLGLPVGLGTLKGISVFERTEDLPTAIGAGIGGFVGLKSPEIFKGTLKLGKGLFEQEKKLLLDKRGKAQLFPQQQDEVVQAVDEFGRVITISKSEARARGLTIISSGMQRVTALGEFSRATRDKQAEIIKKAFEQKLKAGVRYADRESLLKDIKKATKFMKEAGLSNQKIEEVLSQAFPSLFQPVVIQTEGFTEATKQVVDSQVTQPVSPSIWAGTGLYERTETESLFGQQKRQTQRLSLFEKSEIKQDMRESQLSKSLISMNLGTSLFSLQQPKLQTRQLELQKERQTQRSLTIPKTTTKQVSKVGLISMSLLDSPQKQPPIKTTKKEPKFGESPPILLKGLGIDEDKEKKILDEDEFKVFVRKKGEDIKVGKFGTLPEAETFLGEKLRTTLRASGFIEDTKGRKLDINLGRFGAGFRVGKTEPFRLVEKREKRLKIGTGEIGEILKSRGHRKRKGGFL